jgi:hypothetical protein
MDDDAQVTLQTMIDNHKHVLRMVVLSSQDCSTSSPLPLEVVSQNETSYCKCRHVVAYKSYFLHS